MKDVHDLMQSNIIGFIVAGSALCMYAASRGMKKELFRNAFIISCLFALLLIPFSYTFEHFHKLFFPQGNWQFPIDSWLITHFPPVFFVWVSIAWFGLALVMLGVGYWLKVRTKKE